MDELNSAGVDYEDWLTEQPTQLMRFCTECWQKAPIGTTEDVSDGKGLCLDCYTAGLEQVEHPDDEAWLRAEAFGPDQPSQDALWEAAQAARERENEGRWDNYVPDEEDDGERHADVPEPV